MDGDAIAAEGTAEPLEQPFSELKGSGRGEIGSAAMARIAVQGELRHRERGAADVRERPLHPASLLEDAKTGDLRGEAFAILGSVVRADPEEDDDTGFDLGHALIPDVDGGRANALNDRAR